MLRDGFASFQCAIDHIEQRSFHYLFEQDVIVNTHPAEECCIALNEDNNKLWIMLQAKDASTLEYRHLSAKDKILFDASRGTELKALFDLQAYRILSLEDSLSFGNCLIWNLNASHQSC